MNKYELLSIINYRVSSIKYQISIINYQISVIKYQEQSINYQVSIIKYQLSRINNQQELCQAQGKLHLARLLSYPCLICLINLVSLVLVGHRMSVDMFILVSLEW